MAWTVREGPVACEERHFALIAERVRTAAGIVLNPGKRDAVAARVSGRLRQLGMADLDSYLAHLDADRSGQELQHLLNRLTTNVTAFYREAHHFEDLAALIAARRAEGQKRFRVWSAACSTGEEPYTIALTLNAALSDIDATDTLVLATDIDTDVLAKAKAGRYTAQALEAFAPEDRRLFHRDGEHIEAAPELKARIRFRQLNLNGPWPIRGPFDAIFCRNVVIYFDRPTQLKVFERLGALLAPHGRLYIGHSENAVGVKTLRLVGKTTYAPIRAGDLTA